MPQYASDTQFVTAIKALSERDTSRIAQIEGDRAAADQSPVMVGIWTTLSTLRDAGIATMADNGWWSFRHPQLSCLWWKTSIGNYEQPGPCLMLAAHGKIIVMIWPRQDGLPLVPIWTDLSSVADVAEDRDVTPNPLRPFLLPPGLS